MSEAEGNVRAALLAAGFENAAHEARLLCEAFAGAALDAALARRLSHEPLQYILGEWGFWHETYEVNPACLSPRPDTELLVEKAVALLPHGARFLDLCTGSGCVAVSTLASRPDTAAVAVDLFPETLALAARNAARNGVDKRFAPLLADVLAAPAENVLKLAPFAAILANPPYIPDAVVQTLSPEVRAEPAAALCGGADGLDFYRAILGKWQKLLTSDGFLLLEIGYDQAAAVTALAAQNALMTTVFRDLGGNDRVVYLQKR